MIVLQVRCFIQRITKHCSSPTTQMYTIIVAVACAFVVSHFTNTFAEYRDGPIVTTNYGPVRGRLALSRNGNSYYSFTKIPFAKPPIGERRFKAPEAPDPWTEVVDAQSIAPICIQRNYLQGPDAPLEGNEDCLYLNVYSPRLYANEFTFSRENPLPVMVYINWGAFIAGFGNENYLGPEYFMDHDVVLVTFNYRLGVLGFLSTDDDAAPGNFGFKDQVAALRWVKDNIWFFGGNNKSITIFGQSAGAGSVHLHMMSPSSRNLFHRAISSSGAGLDLWLKPLNEVQKTVANLQAAFVGCNRTDSDTTAMVDCLRKVDAGVLVNSSSNFKYFDNEPYTPFTVVIERQTDKNPLPFLTKEPLKIVEDGEIANVPLMMGVTQNEGILKAAPLLRRAAIREQMNAAFDMLLPNMLGLSLSVNTSEIPNVWQKVKDFYLGGENKVDINNPGSVQGFIDMYSDRSFVYGIYQTALLQSATAAGQIWLYNFNYRGKDSYGDYFATTKDDINFKWGVSHCDDLIYLFKSPAVFGDKQLTEQNDIRMSSVMLKLFTNFANYGNPTPANDPDYKIWNPIPSLKDQKILNNNYLKYINISGSVDTKIDLLKGHSFLPDRMKFWEDLPLAENIDRIQ